VVDHERGFCRSEGRGSDDEVAFIFTVGAVEDEDEFTGGCEKRVLVG
jgi:hypothetical protein